MIKCVRVWERERADKIQGRGRDSQDVMYQAPGHPGVLLSGVYTMAPGHNCVQGR